MHYIAHYTYVLPGLREDGQNPEISASDVSAPEKLGRYILMDFIMDTEVHYICLT